MAKNKQKSRNTPITTSSPIKGNSTPIAKNSTAVSQPVSNFDIPFLQNSTVIMALLAVAVLIAFFGGFANDFVYWDDPAYVSENKMVQTPNIANLIRIVGVECALNYHPLTMATLWLNAFLFGKGATSFIIVNTLIHLLNTLLVFKFIQKLTNKGRTVNNNFVAFFTALLWGIHPMHVESVTWIAERKDVLYSFFFLLSCIQYVNFLESEASPGGASPGKGSSSLKFLIFSFLFFVLACLAKGMAVVLPVVLLLIDYWYDKKWLSPKNIIQKIPFFIVALLFGALAVHVQSGGNLGGRLEKMSMDTALSSVFSLGQKLSFGFYGFLVYILKLFVPINQHNFYAYPPTDQSGDVQFVTAPIWGMLVLGVAIWAYGRRKEVFFGIMFFFVTIVLVLQFLSVGGAILAERYTYLPYIGLIFMVVYLLSNKVNQKTLAGILGIVAVIFIILTYRQTLTYKSTESLFQNSFKYETGSAVVNENLANYYGKKGEYQKTLQYGEAAVAKGVSSYGLLGAMGNAYYLSGNYPKAAEFFEKAIPATPVYRRSSVYYNRGIMNRAAGNYAQAASDFDNAIKLDTSSIRAYLGQRAYSLLLAKQYQQSIADYNKMIAMKISIDTAYNNRAVDRFSLGDREGAIQDLQQVLKINPNYTDAKNNLTKLGVK